MKYNERYDLYLDDDFVIYFWNKKLNKLIQRPIYKDKDGYLVVSTKLGTKSVHRIIYESFISPIPDGYQIDHINTIKTDNRLENLKLVTHKENMNNPLTLLNLSNSKKGMIFSEFGRKFKEHYGITKYQNPYLYNKEKNWYHSHNKVCSWEV